MKQNPWTLALVGAGLVSLPAMTQAEEHPNSVLTSLSSTTISGYVDTSAQWNLGTGNANLPPYAFGGTSKADGFNLNVVKLTIEKPINPEDTWSAGYKADLLFGPDANALATTSTGLATSDFAVKQAYISLHTPVGNGLDFKMGVWDTIIGYEVFESGNNPNFTRSYGYTMEPTTHTGLLGSYIFCESFSVNFGIADTFGPTINGRANPPDAESYKAYMGSATFTAPKEWGFLAGSAFTGGVINGFNSAVGQNQTSLYAGASVMTPVTGLRVGAAFDYVDVHDLAGEDWSIGGYASFQATEKLSFHARAEYLKDRGDQKLFVQSIPDPADPTTSVTRNLAPDQVLALTGTVQYDLWKNVLSRLEFRWDRSLNGYGVWGGTTTPTFDDPQTGTAKNAFVILANFVYKF